MMRQMGQSKMMTEGNENHHTCRIRLFPDTEAAKAMIGWKLVNKHSFKLSIQTHQSHYYPGVMHFKNEF